MRYLCGICNREALLPKSLAIPLRFDPTEHPLRHGKSADVWRDQYHDREIAAKVLRVYSGSNLEEITRVGRWLHFWLTVRTNN